MPDPELPVNRQSMFARNRRGKVTFVYRCGSDTRCVYLEDDEANDLLVDLEALSGAAR